MDANDIIENMKRFVCTSFSVEERGINAYLVHTGFFFPDGDELHIVLRLVDGRWILTDNGHTLMWLSYEDFNMTPTRESLLRKAVESNFLTLDEDCISVDVDPSNGSAALRSMVQALLQIADLLYLDRQTVRSTFAGDRVADPSVKLGEEGSRRGAPLDEYDPIITDWIVWTYGALYGKTGA